MFTRRQFLQRTLQASSLVALGHLVPGFVVNTARAADAGKDTVLILIEMTGGNDGLNMVIPYTDDLYYKARPTLGVKKEQAIKVTDSIGLNPGLRPLDPLLQQGELAVVQGVGYPNPNRSHFESMDVWQSAEVDRKPSGTGWLGRGVADLQDRRGGIPALHLGAEKLPLALQGAPSGVVSLNAQQPFKLNLGGEAKRQKTRKQLLMELALEDAPDHNDLFQFVQRRQVQTYTNVETLQELVGRLQPTGQFGPTALGRKMELIAQLINRGLGTRIFYVALDGFDTHSGQAEAHARLFAELGQALAGLFAVLRQTGQDKRVLVMTYSEFGRRVQENGSRGTDHGAGSCLFVAGPGVKAGLVGKHPSLSDLDAGDLKHHTDFRQVYATLLDGWLGCDSKNILGGEFRHLDLLRAKG